MQLIWIRYSKGLLCTFILQGKGIQCVKYCVVARLPFIHSLKFNIFLSRAR